MNKTGPDTVECWLTEVNGQLVVHPRGDTFPVPDGGVEGWQSISLWREILSAQLDELDRKSIRALRSNDTERLLQIEAQAEGFRNILRELASL